MDVIAVSGSSEDIQDAVDTVYAGGGGTAYVPAGDFDFEIDPLHMAPNNSPAGVISYGGVNIIGAGKNRTILRETPEPPADGYMFTINGQNAEPLRISGVSFVSWPFTEEGDPYTRAICVMRATDWRVDHCTFENFSSKSIYGTNIWGPYGNNRGLVDHCDIDNPYMDDEGVIGEGGGEKVWPYGVQIDGTGYSWIADIDDILGKYDTVTDIVYIEDCTFNRCRHAAVASPGGGGFYVLRHCEITEPRYQGMTDVHGPYDPDPARGGRGLEAYNNNFVAYPGYHYGEGMAFLIRGGGGVIYDNTITDAETFLYLAKEGTIELCWVHNLWIWNNTLIDTPTFLSNPGEFVEDVDYFLYEKSGYVPYQYPHPLAGNGDNGQVKMEKTKLSHKTWKRKSKFL